MAKAFRFQHQSINRALPSEDKCLSLLKNYIAHTEATTPASTLHPLLNYESLNRSGTCFIDGGFGEIWRCEFLKMLRFRVNKAIRNKNFPKINQLLASPRGDIFIPEIIRQIQEGCTDHLKKCIQKMPDIDEIGTDNWIDIFILRSRYMNVYGPQQCRMDNHALAIMPFAQPSLLKLLFSIPATLRKNGKLFRHLIKQNTGALTRYPLAKNRTTYPFWMDSLTAKLYLKMMNRFQRNEMSSSQSIFLFHLKAYIQEILCSQSFRETGYYEHKRIETAVHKYFKGESQYGNMIDWWLAFDIYRQILSHEI